MGKSSWSWGKDCYAIDNQFWGERYGKLVDPFGHTWSLPMQVSMTRKEREAKRRAAMDMLTQGKHPGKSD